MSKFKVGDRVRCLVNVDNFYHTKGKIGTICEIGDNEFNKWIVVNFDEHISSKGSEKDCGWCDEDLGIEYGHGLFVKHDGDLELAEEEKSSELNLQVKYIDKNITPLKKIEGGDLVDLRVSRVFKINGDKKEETSFPCEYKFGDTLFFKLGFAMKMPPNKKANVYPRSSTFKNYGFILTNSVGQIDQSYCGNGDEWCAMVWCTREGIINYDDRILQFEVVNRTMENVTFEIVEDLSDTNRGGYGSTGIK